MTETLEGANKIVSRYVKWSAGAGIIPFPVWDIAAVSATQIKMLHALANHYNVEFKKELVRSILGSLLGGVSSRILAYGSVGQVAKSVPGVGTLFGMIAMPITSAASAYAVGKVFIKHFEMGGTFLDFNTSSSREYFEKELAEKTQAPPASTSKKESK